MPAVLLLFSLGVIAASFLPQLPPLGNLLALLCAVLILWLLWIRYFSVPSVPRVIWKCTSVSFPCAIAFLAGITWGVYSGHQLLRTQLMEAHTGKDFIVTGVIDSLPQIQPARTGFVLKVQSVSTTRGDLVATDSFPHKLKLAWYHNDSSYTLKTGDYWQFKVRLKPPRGFVNPAGFDYQAWLLRRGIGATGYVVNHARNQPLPVIELPPSFSRWIDIQRYQLQQWLLAQSDSSERGILIALLIGDSELVTKTQWQRMQQTGTNHLIAISGLHVGFLAIFGFYVGLWIGKLLQLCWHKCPALIIAYVGAISCAVFYSALAGFNIPTLRTAIMLTLFYWLAIHRRSVRGLDIYCVALALVMVIDPLAAFDMGFWLSFGAVGLLLFYFSGRYRAKKHTQMWRGFSPTEILIGFLRSQWVMFIGLLVPLSFLIHSVSLLSPIANFIAIPLVTFFVVPCLLLAAALQSFCPALSHLCLVCAEVGMEWLKIWLDFLLAIGNGKLNPVIAFSPGVAALLLISCLILLLPKGLIVRSLGYGGLALGLTLSLLLPAPQPADLRVTVLDVGQGTAVVVETPKHTLVYDTGPAYSEEFDAGSAIVSPYLFSQGVTQIDALVVSHMDKDHAGGLAGLLEKIHPDKLLMGEFSNRVDTTLNPQNCHQAPSWQWDHVRFRFLTWPISTSASANNHSCVLLISYAGQTILLPGDIERDVEQQLLRHKQLPANIQLLLAPHHGSHSSSTVGFVNYTAPQEVVYSAGYRNQHGHPHRDIRSRYQAVGSREWNTATQGALVFEWRNGAFASAVSYREKARRYWFARE